MSANGSHPGASPHAGRLGSVAVAALVAVVVGTLLWVDLDSGIVSPEPTARVVSLPLVGLALIFGVRAWDDARAGTARCTRGSPSASGATGSSGSCSDG
jgi:hypothetical protein